MQHAYKDFEFFWGTHHPFLQWHPCEFTVNNVTFKWIVEASPVDSIWGIGLGVNDPKAQQPELWEGLNLLGEVLMQVRTNLMV